MRKRGVGPRVTPPPSDSTVYDGSQCLGTIQGRKGVFKAVDAAGRKLGTFDTPQEAMRCICAARKAVG